MAVAADVPGVYDVVIDGNGYVLANTELQRAVYGFTPTFVTRQNVSGSYGDNEQDFWLTVSQNDWSLGEGQKFFRPRDDESRRRYFSAENVDVSIPGQITNALPVATSTFAQTIYGCCGASFTNDLIYAFGLSNLYSINASGTISSKGAHSAGTPFPRAICTDGNNVFLGGGTNLRKYDIGAATFSTFSAGGYMALAFSANTLYGIPSTMDALDYFDTSGTSNTAYSWTDADGSARGPITNIIPFGGGVFIVRAGGEQNQGPELYTGDTTGVTKVAALPPNFRCDDACVAYGIVFIAGTFLEAGKSRSAVYYYANGNVGLLWKSLTAGDSSSVGTVPAITAFRDGLVWTDESVGAFMFYDLATGCISTVGTFTAGIVSWTNSSAVRMAAAATFLLYTSVDSDTIRYPSTDGPPTVTVTTSQFDFESSLQKYVKAVKLDFESNGGTVDIAYELEGVDGTYTTVQTGATAGTEYTIGQTCHTISLRITLNPGIVSAVAPTLKRIYVRAAPILQQFRRQEYVLDLSGRDGKTPVVLRNGNPHPLDGLAQATNLRTSALKTTPITITDRFGTYTGIVELDNFDLIEVRPEEFVARVKVRQV